MVGPSLLRHIEPGRADEFAAACRDVTPPEREEELLKLETAEAEARELRPRLREAMGPKDRARGRDKDVSTILTVCEAQLILSRRGRKGIGLSWLASRSTQASLVRASWSYSLRGTVVSARARERSSEVSRDN